MGLITRFYGIYNVDKNQTIMLEKNIKREKKTGRPHLKNLKNSFFFKKKIKLSFFLAFLGQIYPLTNPLYVINFSKKLLSVIKK